MIGTRAEKDDCVRAARKLRGVFEVPGAARVEDVRVRG